MSSGNVYKFIDIWECLPLELNVADGIFLESDLGLKNSFNVLCLARFIPDGSVQIESVCCSVPVMCDVLNQHMLNLNMPGKNLMTSTQRGTESNLHLLGTNQETIDNL